MDYHSSVFRCFDEILGKKITGINMASNWVFNRPNETLLTGCNASGKGFRLVLRKKGLRSNCVCLSFTLIQRSRISMISRSPIISETRLVQRNCRRETAMAPVVWNTTRGIPNLEADCAVQGKNTSLMMQAGFGDVSAIICSSHSSNGWESLCKLIDSNWASMKERTSVLSQPGGDARDGRERKRNETNRGSDRLQFQFGGIGGGGEEADGEALGSKNFSQAEEGNEMALRHVR